MRRVRDWLWVALCGLCLTATCMGAQPVVKEGFEGEQPKLPVLWATNAAKWTVNAADVTEERSFSGKICFKVVQQCQRTLLKALTKNDEGGSFHEQKDELKGVCEGIRC